MKTICIIPARGGSKGIKNKNLQLLNKKPLIYYPIQAAKKSKICDEIFVTTDSKKIANIARKYGATVPFLRQKKISKSSTTTERTLQNALLDFEKYKKTKYDICIFLSCTNFFRRNGWISEAYNILKNNKSIDSAFIVVKLYRHFWFIKDGKHKKVVSWMKNYHSRQTAPKLFREETGLACATRSKFWRKGKRIGKKVKLMVRNDPFTGIDINNKDDLKIARIIFEYIKKNKLTKNIIV